MVAGRGWIALALTTFATWRPARVLIGAYLFGGVTILSLHAQGMGAEIVSQLLSMLPYLATILYWCSFPAMPTGYGLTCRPRWASLSIRRIQGGSHEAERVHRNR
jgi:ABC-type uncharacterized transport system permease subunit